MSEGFGKEPQDETRRDFIVLSASAMAAVGAGAAAWPLVSQMSPAEDSKALASIEQDISAIQPGQGIKVMWRGKPVFIRRRTPAEIEEARTVKLDTLIDPEEDTARVKEGKDEWLILVGVCTHLGCVPLADSGDYDGWFCPCHGSHYDISGRIRRGPAPKNLVVPEYTFLNDTTVRIG